MVKHCVLVLVATLPAAHAVQSARTDSSGELANHSAASRESSRSMIVEESLCPLRLLRDAMGTTIALGAATRRDSVGNAAVALSLGLAVGRRVRWMDDGTEARRWVER